MEMKKPKLSMILGISKGDEQDDDDMGSDSLDRDIKEDHVEFFCQKILDAVKSDDSKKLKLALSGFIDALAAKDSQEDADEHEGYADDEYEGLEGVSANDDDYEYK